MESGFVEVLHCLRVGCSIKLFDDKSRFSDDSYFTRYRVKSSQQSLEGSSIDESSNFREKSFHVWRDQKKSNQNGFSMPREEEEADSSTISWSDRSPSPFGTHSSSRIGIFCLVRKDSRNLLRCYGPVHVFQPRLWPMRKIYPIKLFIARGQPLNHYASHKCLKNCLRRKFRVRWYVKTSRPSIFVITRNQNLIISLTTT